MRSLLIGMLLLTGLVGCGYRYTAGVSTQSVSVDNMTDVLEVSDNRILGSRIELTRAGVEPLADGRSLGQASIQSLYTADMSVQYRFYWFDANGTQLPIVAWKPLLIHGKQEVQLQSMSETSEARSFKLYIRTIEN